MGTRDEAAFEARLRSGLQPAPVLRRVINELKAILRANGVGGGEREGVPGVEDGGDLFGLFIFCIRLVGHLCQWSVSSGGTGQQPEAPCCTDASTRP